METLIHLFIMAVIVMITAAILPGATVRNFWTSLIVAIIIGLLNSFLMPILIFITIPITVVTFGMFLLVLNAFVIWLAAAIVKGFYVENFWWALAFAAIISIFHAVFGISGPEYKIM